MHATIRLIPLALGGLTLALATACSSSSKLDGTYTSKNMLGEQTYEFRPNGKVLVSMVAFGFGSPKQELDYERTGSEVRIVSPMGVMVGTIGEDGCLEFGTGVGTFCKRNGEGKSAQSSKAASESNATTRAAPERAPPAEAREASPPEETRPQEPYDVRAAKADLRNLVTAQEAFFAFATREGRPARYANSIAELGTNYRASEGTVVTIVRGLADGFEATATRAGYAGTCRIIVGLSSPNDGEPICM